MLTISRYKDSRAALYGALGRPPRMALIRGTVSCAGGIVLKNPRISGESNLKNEEYHLDDVRTVGFDECYGFGGSWCWIKNPRVSGERLKSDKEYHLDDVETVEFNEFHGFGGSWCWIKNPRVSREID